MNRQRMFLLAVFGLTGFLVAGCASQKFNTPELVQNATVMDDGEPSHITVQHILIGFKGSVQGKEISRDRKEAERFANELFDRADSGENFAKLVDEYTDDTPPGIYHLANVGQASDMTSGEAIDNVYPRNGMVPAFGNVGFHLDIGEVGMSEYDRHDSPYGWHIVKRLK